LRFGPRGVYLIFEERLHELRLQEGSQFLARRHLVEQLELEFRLRLQKFAPAPALEELRNAPDRYRSCKGEHEQHQPES
jgi:hypothetical protein